MEFEVDLKNNLPNKLAKEIASKLDCEMYKFLEKNGYQIERNNIEQLTKLRDELAKEDKQIRVETRIIEQCFGEELFVRHHELVFFDSISNPLNDDQVTEMILKSYELGKEWKK